MIFKKQVPKDRLVHHVEKENIDCNKNNMDEMYEALCDRKKQLVENIFNEYKYAGKTSMNIFEIVGFPKHLNNKKNFLLQLQKKLGIQKNILNVQLKPNISDVPQINLIENTQNGYRIQWVQGHMVESSNGYETISRMDARYVTTIISFGTPLFIEIRAGYKPSSTYIKLISQLISEDDNIVELTKLPLTKLTELEAKEVADKLKAGLREGEHLGSNGIGRYAISADKETNDLRELDEYKNNYMRKQYLSQTLNVRYEEKDSGYVTNVKFQIKMNGGFEFKTKVSEKIIRRIFDVFAEVRYKKDIASGE